MYLKHVRFGPSVVVYGRAEEDPRYALIEQLNRVYIPWSYSIIDRRAINGISACSRDPSSACLSAANLCSSARTSAAARAFLAIRAWAAFSRRNCSSSSSFFSFRARSAAAAASISSFSF